MAPTPRAVHDTSTTSQALVPQLLCPTPDCPPCPHPLGSDTKRQILLFPTTSRTTPRQGHAIAYPAAHHFSLEKFNKTPTKGQGKQGQADLAEGATPRAAGSRVLICSSHQGQISSLKVREAPAWQAVPSQRGLGWPRAQPRAQLCSGSICSGCTEEAGGSAEPQPGPTPAARLAAPAGQRSALSLPSTLWLCLGEKLVQGMRDNRKGGQLAFQNPSHPPLTQ